jgi:hypothetical protein
MGRRTLILVEDDAPLRQQYRIALAFEGFEVREAATGLDAITSIDRWPPDLIVLPTALKCCTSSPRKPTLARFPWSSLQVLPNGWTTSTSHVSCESRFHRTI